MKVWLAGVGVWGRGLLSYAQLCQRVAGVAAPDEEFMPPKPEAIPARERRRAGLMINLAVTAAHQACEHAGADKQQIPSVFVSSMGDTDITDYMCRKLAQPEKLLSPTKFHNSVHNAPSGYWSISAQNRAPSTFIGGAGYSFGAGLLEAASQAHDGGEPVLLVAYDIANRPPFASVAPVTESFACALVLVPDGHPVPVPGAMAVQLDISLQPQPAAAVLPRAPALAALAAANPAAAGLVLLEQAAQLDQGGTAEARVELPAAAHLGLNIALNGP